MKEYAYSEIFYSMQGEGRYTGYPTAWLRFFLCNLQCDGFGQEDPTNPETYKLPYKDIIATDYERLEDLPVFEYGCDSSYSWSKKFKHLQYKGTADEITKRILDVVPNQNFAGKHLCFTGGEPLMRHAQEATVEIMKRLIADGNYPDSITFETNGTQDLTEEFFKFWSWENETVDGIELFMSVSPKLFTVSGEKQKKAIKPHVVSQYTELTGFNGQLKFVVNGTDECWQELEEVVTMYRDAGVFYPVWIMPIGATVEGQKGELPGAKFTDGQIADQALQRGYKVSARVHTYLWGNVIGV